MCVAGKRKEKVWQGGGICVRMPGMCHGRQRDMYHRSATGGFLYTGWH